MFLYVPDLCIIFCKFASPSTNWPENSNLKFSVFSNKSWKVRRLITGAVVELKVLIISEYYQTVDFQIKPPIFWSILHGSSCLMKYQCLVYYKLQQMSAKNKIHFCFPPYHHQNKKIFLGHELISELSDPWHLRVINHSLLNSLNSLMMRKNKINFLNVIPR